MAVASAGPYANLHLTPCQHLTTQFFTSRMPFLLPNQQRQSTEGTWLARHLDNLSILCLWWHIQGGGLAEGRGGCRGMAGAALVGGGAMPGLCDAPPR